MSVDGMGGVVGDRGLIEEAARLLIASAPRGWTYLRGEFEPAAHPPTASASVTTESGEQQPLTASAEIYGVIAEHQRRAAAVGAPWKRLVIDCHCDGRLSAHVEGATAAAGLPDPQRIPRRLLAALTAGCLIAAAVVFAVGWRWIPPPRAEMVAPPSPPPRQQEAFAVLSKWFDAMNHADAAGMRAVSCRNPSPTIAGWYKSERVGETQAYTYPEAVTSVVENGGLYAVSIAVREHPLDEYMRLRVDEAQKNGGFVFYYYVLADEGGQLKVCDDQTEAHR